MLAGRSWSVSALPGGLTNVNVRVISQDDLDPRLDLVVRCSRGDANLLGIDRDAENLNTRTAAAVGVGAPVVEYRPDLGMLVIGFLPGHALVDGDFTDPDVLARAARSVRALHAGPRFTGDFDMFGFEPLLDVLLDEVRIHITELRAGGGWGEWHAMPLAATLRATLVSKLVSRTDQRQREP